MENIKVKDSIIIHPLFFIALNTLLASKLPVPLMKLARRITKKLREENEELKQDTNQIIKDVFADRFTDEEIKKICQAEEKDRLKACVELQFPPDKAEDMVNSLKAFDQKCKELGDQVCDIPFPKIVLPDSFEFRTDYAMLLEDVIDLD